VAAPTKRAIIEEGKLTELPPLANAQESEARHERESGGEQEREQEKAKTSVNVKKEVTLPPAIYSSGKKPFLQFTMRVPNRPEP
jgi:hypothetical protein